MNKQLIACVIGCLLALLLVSPISATQKQIHVDEKRIDAGGKSCSPSFIVSQLSYDQMQAGLPKVSDEYTISMEDYYKINIGDTITIDTSDIDMYGQVKVIW